MGQCAGIVDRKKSKRGALQCYWKQPSDTTKFQKENLPKLPFQGTLGNFKIKNCAYPQLSIRVELSGIETFFLKQKRIRNNMSAKWAFEQKFMFEKTLYELRKSFIEIYFQDEDEKVVGDLKVNLFLISNGPYHQDFSVKLKKGENTRLSFDMKLSQIIQVQLESLDAEIDLKTKHPDETFNFSIKTIISHNTNLEVTSRPSYSVIVLLEGNQSSSEDMEAPKIQRKITDQKLIPAGNNLIWSKSVSGVMPSIRMKTLVSQLHHSYFQILVWKINDKRINSLNKIQTSQLFGECYIALHKMFLVDPSENKNQNKLIDERIIESTEKIWHHGQQIGSGNFRFKINNEKYIKQMQVMVMTEVGIRVYSPVIFNNQKNSKGSRCEELAQVIKLIGEVENQASRLDEVESGSNFPSIESRKIKIQIQGMLQNLIELLIKSSKQSITCFSYSSDVQFIRAQGIFIELGFKMTDYLLQQDALINQRCWELLIVLLKRGQFLLAHMGFDEKQRQQLKSTERSPQIESKIQVGLMYQRFLNKQLQLSLNSLNVKGLEIERTFAELFFAHAYFRIPVFRNKLLEAIVRPDDPEIPQWRGIQFSLQGNEDFDSLKLQMCAFAILCDWQSCFHKCLQKQEKAIANTSEVEQILQQKNWQETMSKRGSAFFYFLIYWVDYIQAIIIKTSDIQWRYFPGYNKILKCFLVEMKKRSILQYPDAMKVACHKLLSNQKLLNPFVSIVLAKGNIYEPLTVLKTIQFVNEIFVQLSKNNRTIPGTFNSYQLYKAIKIILEGDLSFAVSKTLVMLYSNFKMFHLEFRKNISMLLLGKVFFKLFLHWSHNVRDTFYHLVVMRIYRESLQLEDDISVDMRIFQEKMNEEVRTRYNQLILILENAYALKLEQKKHSFVASYEKILFKTLKKKMFERKKRLNKKQSFDLNDDNELFSLQPPSSPWSVKNSEREIMFLEKYSVNALSKVNRKVQRSQSQIVKPALKVNYKTQSIETEQVRRSKKTNNYDFKHEIYDTTGGKKMPIGMKNVQLINKYQEGDFQIGKIQPEQIQYIDTGINHYRKIKQTLKNHSNDRHWQVPVLKLQVPLDIHESRPDKIDSW